MHGKWGAEAVRENKYRESESSALYLKALHSPSSNIPTQIQTVNHYLRELTNYSFIMCPAKSCQAPLFEAVNPLAQAAWVQPCRCGAAGTEPVKAAIVALLRHRELHGKPWPSVNLGKAKQSPNRGVKVTGEVWLYSRCLWSDRSIIHNSGD